VDHSQHSKRALTIAAELAERVGHENGPRRLTDLIVENAEQDPR